MNHNRPYYGKKVCVIIPCKDRMDMLNSTLPRWLEQIYPNYQICIVDYSSKQNIYPHILRYANRYHVDIDYNQDFSNAKISVLRLEGQETFNMSHAINYALRRTNADVYSIAGTDSVASPFYLEIVMMCVDSNIFTRCMRGRISFTRKMIDDVNGYPENLKYWGAEDDVVIWQIQQNGNYLIDVSYLLVHDINHHGPDYGTNNFYRSLSQTHNRELGLQDYSAETRRFYGSTINLLTFDYQQQQQQQNNDGHEYGGILPICNEDNTVLSEVQSKSYQCIVDTRNNLMGKYCTPLQKTYYGRRVAVIIPCMNRLDNLSASLPQWIDQLYYNKQLVIIDYSSDVPIIDKVRDIASQFHCKVAYQTYEYDANIMVFRLEKQKFFNISHAYNYAITRIQADIICTICADSCPHDYYLDTCVNLLTDFNLIQCHWGLHTITYSNWQKLNGHQEFIVGWGGEDVDFQVRAKMMGLYPVVIPKQLVFHIPQNDVARGLFRQVSNNARSFLINDQRFIQYIASFGYVGNYGLNVGMENPIENESNGIIKTDIRRLFICQLPQNDRVNLPQEIKYSTEYDLHYVISEDFFTWNTSENCRSATFLIHKDDNVDKFLYFVTKMDQPSKTYLDMKPS